MPKKKAALTSASITPTVATRSPSGATREEYIVQGRTGWERYLHWLEDPRHPASLVAFTGKSRPVARDPVLSSAAFPTMNAVGSPLVALPDGSANVVPPTMPDAT